MSKLTKFLEYQTLDGDKYRIPIDDIIGILPATIALDDGQVVNCCRIVAMLPAALSDAEQMWRGIAEQKQASTLVVPDSDS